MRRTRIALVVLSGAAVAGILFYSSTTVVIADTMEDIWPDPVDRQYVLLRAVSRKLQSYSTQHGRLPESLAELGAAELPGPVGERPNWHDVWNVPLRYTPGGDQFTLNSAGPDRLWGTTDDLHLIDGTTYAAKRRLEGRDTATRLPVP